MFGINTTNDISKLLYVISRPVRRVKFETILKYHEWYLCQISRTNHAIICLYYYLRKVCTFHIQVFQIKVKYHCSEAIKLQQFLMQQYKCGNPRESWILDSTMWIPDSRYWIPSFLSMELGFGISIFSGISDFLS